MRARRRIAGLAVLSLLACVLAASAASATAAPHACCPETQRSDTPAPVSPCVSLLPTPCCGHGLAGHTASPLPLPPAALFAPASPVPPDAASASACVAGARAASPPARAAFVLRL